MQSGCDLLILEHYEYSNVADVEMLLNFQSVKFNFTSCNRCHLSCVSYEKTPLMTLPVYFISFPIISDSHV